MDIQFIFDYLGLENTWFVDDIPKEILSLYAEDVQTKLDYQKGDWDVKNGLTRKKFKEFETIHNKHIRQWESERRIKQHIFSNIEKLEWVEDENCFHVHFKQTDEDPKVWYHYELDGTWW